MKLCCDACNAQDIYTIYKLDRIPAFQNKLFKTEDAARNSPLAKVNLSCCPHCGLIFNAAFKNDLMDYDDDYQNSQDNSASFRAHLDEMATLMTRDLEKAKDKIVEIGCGKAYFFQMLEERGFDIVGFDPTYEGHHPRVTKQYFNRETAQGLQADAIIMRHTLEHIERPYDFLVDLKTFLPAETTMYIEVPRFEWIAAHNAFWDIFHEHCNYFTEEFFRIIFSGKVDITPVFAGQYMVIKAKIGDLKADLSDAVSTAQYRDVFKSGIPVYANEIKKHKTNYVWGAGAKGIAFANILDPHGLQIASIIDINPKKQGHYAPLTAHVCQSPDSVDWSALEPDTCLWIMNDNYAREIIASIPHYKGHVFTLGETHAAA